MGLKAQGLIFGGGGGGGGLISGIKKNGLKRAMVVLIEILFF